jgi:hypothetical protein
MSDEEKTTKIHDLRDRLPARIFGNNEAGELAVKVLEVILQHGGGKPHNWFASLMMVSYALQRILKEGYKWPHEQLSKVFEVATEIAETTQIGVGFKTDPAGEPAKVTQVKPTEENT